jgi:hypothetical protein
MSATFIKGGLLAFGSALENRCFYGFLEVPGSWVLALPDLRPSTTPPPSPSTAPVRPPCSYILLVSGVAGDGGVVHVGTWGTSMGGFSASRLSSLVIKLIRNENKAGKKVGPVVLRRGVAPFVREQSAG